MKFTIVIPIFNRVQYIPETLDSVIRQTYTDLEIICVDDCSADNSAALLRNYAQKDTRIKILTHKENKGPHVARKTGAECVILPNIDDVMSGNLHVQQLRNVEIEDLLGRDPVQLDQTMIEKQLRGKKILVTGAGGSIGSEICRQVAKFQASS